MKKLLTATVSWQRPELCKKMIKSFLKTKTFADLFVYICDDDPHLTAYTEVIKEFPEVKFEIGKHLFIAEVSNYIHKKFDYEYYQMVNDDHEFIESGWDEDMIFGCDEHDGWRIAASYMPDELIINNQLNAPTCEIFSKKLIKAMGFYNPIGFRQYGCDGFIMDLGKDLGGIIPYVGKIMHNCWHGINRMEKDATCEWNYSDIEQRHGHEMIKTWKRTKPEILEKIKKAKENER